MPPPLVMYASMPRGATFGLLLRYLPNCETKAQAQADEMLDSYIGDLLDEDRRTGAGETGGAGGERTMGSGGYAYHAHSVTTLVEVQREGLVLPQNQRWMSFAVRNRQSIRKVQDWAGTARRSFKG